MDKKVIFLGATKKTEAGESQQGERGGARERKENWGERKWWDNTWKKSYCNGINEDTFKEKKSFVIFFEIYTASFAMKNKDNLSMEAKHLTNKGTDKCNGLKDKET